jgi:hypothetical protein
MLNSLFSMMVVVDFLYARVLIKPVLRKLTYLVNPISF